MSSQRRGHESDWPRHGAAEPELVIATDHWQPSKSRGWAAQGGTSIRFSNALRTRLNSSVNLRIVRAMLTVAAGSAVVKLVSLTKEMAVAARFGAGDDIDAFVIAFALPSFVISVVASAFQAAVIPTYIEVRNGRDDSASRELVSRLLFWSCALLLAVTIVLIVSGPAVLRLVGAGFTREKLQLTRYLYFLLLPLVMFGGIATIWGAVLNADERFVAVAVVPMATPLMIVVLVLAAAGTVGVYALPAGMLTGSLIEVAVLGWILRRRGLRLLPHLSSIDEGTRTVIRQFAVMCAGAVLMSSTSLVDQWMAAMAGPGSVAVLNYGNRLVLFFLGFCSMALSTAILPHFSSMVAQRDWKSVRSTLRTCLWWTATATIPLTLILIWFSVPVTRLMYERGAFESETTTVVASIQALYVIQVPFYMMGIVLVRLISSLKANHMLTWGSALSVILNISLNYIFMQRYGVKGIALSTSVVYMTSFCFLALAVRTLLRRAEAQNAVST